MPCDLFLISFATQKQLLACQSFPELLRFVKTVYKLLHWHQLLLVNHVELLYKARITSHEMDVAVFRNQSTRDDALCSYLDKKNEVLERCVPIPNVDK